MAWAEHGTCGPLDARVLPFESLGSSEVPCEAALAAPGLRPDELAPAERRLEDLRRRRAAREALEAARPGTTRGDSGAETKEDP